MGSSARGEAKGVGSLTAWRGLLYAAALLSMPLVAWHAQAQSCPGGAYLCPNQDGCCYTGTICGTGSNGCPADSCCPAGGGGSSGGGGGTCGPGQEPCAGRCMPAGAVCCGPQGYCEAGQVCTSNGCINESPSGGGGSGWGSEGYVCSQTIVGSGCSVEYCLDGESCDSYYNVNGHRIPCTSCTDVADCATEAARVCVEGGGSGGSSSGGSSSGGGGSSSGGSSSGPGYPAGADCSEGWAVGDERGICEIEMCLVADGQRCRTFLVVAGGAAQIECPDSCGVVSTDCGLQASSACLPILDARGKAGGSKDDGSDSSSCSARPGGSSSSGAWLLLAVPLALLRRKRRA